VEVQQELDEERGLDGHGDHDHSHRASDSDAANNPFTLEQIAADKHEEQGTIKEYIESMDRMNEVHDDAEEQLAEEEIDQEQVDIVSSVCSECVLNFSECKNSFADSRYHSICGHQRPWAAI
jgi:hypothetical protein